MEWYDKLLNDLEELDSPSIVFDEVYAQVETDDTVYKVPKKVVLASIQHDTLVVGAMRKVCDDGVGRLLQSLSENAGQEYANYIAFQVSALIELLLNRNVTTTSMLKALMENHNDNDKSKDE